MAERKETRRKGEIRRQPQRRNSLTGDLVNTLVAVELVGAIGKAI